VTCVVSKTWCVVRLDAAELKHEHVVHLVRRLHRLALAYNKTEDLMR
jgi:hypothetical protein